jgi:PDGLE domain
VKVDRRRIGLAAFIVGGLVVAAALAFLVSPQASSEPDGLDKVAIDEGFADTETDHALDDAPTAGYAVRGVDDDRLSTGLAGLIGVAVTFAATGLLFLVLRQSSRRRDRPADRADRPAPSAAISATRD